MLMPGTQTEYWVRNKQHMLFRLEWTFLEWACSHRPHLKRTRVESWKEMDFENDTSMNSDPYPDSYQLWDSGQVNLSGPQCLHWRDVFYNP